MRVCVLGSSSGGNSIFVSDGATRLLIDTGGLPVFRYIQPRLAELGEDWDDLDAILISHRHGDHLNGNTFSVALRTDTPVYVAPEVAAWLKREACWFPWPHLEPCRKRGLVRTLDDVTRIGGLEVLPCALPHDCDPTLGFVILAPDGRRVGVATDLGHVPDRVIEHLRDCDVLVFEANHDVEMERSSGRPDDLIERNLGPLGHLSNEQSAAALCEIIESSHRRPRCIFLAHISEDCNRPDLACETVAAALDGEGLDDVAVSPTYPRRPSAVADLRRR